MAHVLMNETDHHNFFKFPISFARLIFEPNLVIWLLIVLILFRTIELIS